MKPELSLSIWGEEIIAALTLCQHYFEDWLSLKSAAAALHLG